MIQCGFSQILAFDKLCYGKTEEEKIQLANSLNIDYEDYCKRIKGKYKEYEFLIFLLFLNKFSIIPYDEEISQITEEETADYKVIDKQNKNESFLLEIKSTEKINYAISKNNLNKRIEFAKKENLPLYFAINIKGFWLLYPAEYLQKNNGKIKIEKDAKNSILYSKFNINSYLFMPNIKVIQVYSKLDIKNIGINFPPYGKLISFEFFYNDRKIFEVTPDDKRYMSLILFLEAFFDKITEENQKIHNGKNNTYIFETFNKIEYVSEINLLLSPYKHLEGVENLQTLYNKLLNKELKLDKNLNLEKIRAHIEYLKHKGVQIELVR